MSSQAAPDWHHALARAFQVAHMCRCGRVCRGRDVLPGALDESRDFWWSATGAYQRLGHPKGDVGRANEADDSNSH